MIGNFELINPYFGDLVFGNFISNDDGVHFKVHLFHRLVVVVDPEASIKPRIRDVICLELDYSKFILVPVDVSKHTIFVVNFLDFEKYKLAF